MAKYSLENLNNLTTSFAFNKERKMDLYAFIAEISLLLELRHDIISYPPSSHILIATEVVEILRGRCSLLVRSCYLL